MARYSIMTSGYLPSEIQSTTRTRDAVRRIRRIPVTKTTQKKLLAEWFRIHERAALDEGAKRRGYLDLLGQEFYTKLRG
jgi:hypothetical protein